EGAGDGRDVDGTDNVGAPCHRRIEFARLEGAVAGAVENATEAVQAEQFKQGVLVLRVHGEDAWTDELPRLRRPDAENLSGMTPLEIWKGVVTGHAGDAGDE